MILTVDVHEARTAGIAAPIASEAFSKERLCYVSHTPLEFDPYTVSASISFLRRSHSIFFVLPTLRQAQTWSDKIINGLSLEPGMKPADRVREYAAVSLIGHRNITIISANTL